MKSIFDDNLNKSVKVMLIPFLLLQTAYASTGLETISRAEKLAAAGKAAVERDDGKTALSSYGECKDILEQGPPNALLAECIDGLGRGNKILARFKEAMPYYQRAMTLRVQLLGEDSVEVASSLNNIAMLHLESGNHGEGRPMLEKALAIYSQREGTTAISTVLTRLNLGQIRRSIGDYHGALQDLDEVLRTLQTHYPDQKKYIALAMLRLAGVHIALGNLEPAYETHKARLAILRQLGNGVRTEIGTSLANMAEIERRMGRHEAAIELLRQAIDHHDQASQEDKLNFATLYYNMGNNLRALGNYNAATEEFRKAIAVREEMQGKWHARLSTFWRALAVVEMEKGDTALAQNAMQKGMTVALANDLPEPQADMYEGLAKVIHQEHPAMASYLGKISVNRYQQLIANVAQSGKGLHRGFVSDNVKVFRTLAEMLLKANRVEEAQQVIASLRAWEYAEFTNTTVAATPVPLLAHELEWDASLNQQNAMLRSANLARQQASVRHQQSKSVADAQTLSEAETRLQQAESAWVARFHQLLLQAQNLQLPKTTISQVLPTTKVSTLQYFFGPRTGFGIVVTSAGKHVFELAESRATLAKRIADFRMAIAQRQFDPSALGESLHQTLIAPAEHLLKNTTTLLISPDEELRYLPFAALRDKQGYIIERFQLGIGDGNQGREPVARSPWRLALFGNSQHVTEYPALPYVSQELRSISKIKNMSARSFLDEQFTRNRLNQSFVDGHNAVHLATHFIFRPGGENDSFLLLGDGSKMTLKDWRTDATDFSKIDLVTLSACDTAVDGKNAFGKEIDGLGTLLIAKGARSVVATLWPVDDIGTSQLMPQFYSALAQGKTKAEALRRAQISFIRKKLVSNKVVLSRGATRAGDKPYAYGHSHPYYWAPFILMGEWR